MQTRKLKYLDVPVIGMGSASSSGFDVETPADIENARRIIDNCIAQGSVFLDTSPMYRRAEGVFGQTLKGRREKVMLATKVWCAGKETGRRQIERSFKLLDTDHIEVFQIHNLVDWKIHLPHLEELKAQGKIDLIGLSHFIPEFYPEMI
jgi:aryl-alcohol dehydrogenase-like predicted oxidoreductase